MSNNDLGAAEAQLERARKNHAPAVMLAEMERSTEAARPWTSTVFHWTWRVLAVWAALSARAASPKQARTVADGRLRIENLR